LGLAKDALAFERAVDGTLLFDWTVAQSLAARVTARAATWPSPVILAPWRGDPHPDHMAAAVIADMVEEMHGGARGLRYFVWTHENAANGVPDDSSVLRFGTGRWLRRKRAAIQAHRTQVSDLIADGPAERRVVPRLDRVLGRDELYLCSEQTHARLRRRCLPETRNVSP
jgi:LmbE family N-acetylglucosaminyl deacetylase